MSDQGPVTTTATTTTATPQAAPNAAPTNGNGKAADAAKVDDAAPPPSPKHKTKSGQEVTLDELLERYEHRSASHKRFEEAAALRKEVEQYVNYLRQSPVEALQALQIDPRTVAERYLQEAIEDAKLTDEQKEIRRLQRENQDHQKRIKMTEQERAQVKLAQDTERYQTEYLQSFSTALDGAGLAPSPATIARMAAIMDGALDNGVPLEPAEAAQMVSEQMSYELLESLEPLSGEQLISVLGEGLLKRIREADIARVKSTSATQRMSNPLGRAQQPEANGSDKVGADDFFRNLRRQYSGA